MTTHVALDPAFAELVDLWAPVRQIGTGFEFTEGPIWHPREHHLLFSDMPGDVRRRWDRSGITEVMRPANKCNGMTYDADLNLIVCEHATSTLVRERTDGRREVLASHFDGRELNSPNDVVVKSDGAIYFSDPWYGRMPVYGVERPRQLGFQGVYRIPPGGGQPQLLVERMLFDQPNGLCFCPDESKLYVNDTVQHVIRVFDVKPDGLLANGRIFASGIVFRQRARRAGWHEMRPVRQCLGLWPRRCLGLCARWAADRQAPRAGTRGQPHLGWAGFPHLVPHRDAFGLCGGNQGRPAQRALYAAGRERPRFCPAGRSQHWSQWREEGRTGIRARSFPLRADHPGHAERCGDGRRAFASSGSPVHCREQNAIGNAARLAAAARQRGIPVIHVWFVVEPGCPGVTMNAPLFEGLADARALVRGTWGVAPVPGLEAQPGDHVVEKQRMSAWEGTRLETVLKALKRDIVIVTGAWTNMSIEHTSRTGADKGYFMVVPEDCCSTMNAEWHTASVNYALQNVAVVTDAEALIGAWSD